MAIALLPFNKDLDQCIHRLLNRRDHKKP